MIFLTNCHKSGVSWVKALLQISSPIYIFLFTLTQSWSIGRRKCHSQIHYMKTTSHHADCALNVVQGFTWLIGTANVRSFVCVRGLPENNQTKRNEFALISFQCSRRQLNELCLLTNLTERTWYRIEMQNSRKFK